MGNTRLGETVVVYREEHAYSSHPFITRTSTGDWLVVFSHSIRQPIGVHPGSDPRFVNLVTRSPDQGVTWERPRVAPGYDWYGVEVAGIATLSTGEVLLNQLRWKFAPTEEAKRQWAAGDRGWYVSIPGWLGWGRSGDQDEGDEWHKQSHHWALATSDDDWARHMYPFARHEDGSFVHISPDGGATWERTATIEFAPYIGSYSRPGAVELHNGDLLLAMQSHDHDPLGAVFTVRSRDRGLSWEKPVEVARVASIRMTEPSLIETASGTLRVMTREDKTGFLYHSVSTDGGFTWGPPAQMAIWGHPAHVINLQDGRLFMAYGYRRAPFGVRAIFSEDEGETWGPELAIRNDMSGLDGGANLGYPAVIEYAPGRLFVVYYTQDAVGVTHIEGTYLDLS
jgi:hypothetical protein